MISRSKSSRRRLRAAVAYAILIAAAAFGRAQAADLDDSWLRGSFISTPGYVRWDGVVMGATLGYGNMSADFGNAAGSEISYILRNTTLEDEFSPSSWTTLPKTVTNSVQYGGFLGYNIQMGQLVLGADIGYNRPNGLTSTVTDSIARNVVTSDDVSHDVFLNSSASIKLVDYATARARANGSASRRTRTSCCSWRGWFRPNVRWISWGRRWRCARATTKTWCGWWRATGRTGWRANARCATRARRS